MLETVANGDSEPRPIGVGDVVDIVSFDVERGKIEELARATFAENDVHTDRELATARGHAGLLATPTYVVVSLHHRDQAAWVARLGLDIERVVVGAVRWTYRRPLVEGDRVVGVRRVTRDETKTGQQGTLRLLRLETDFRDATGAVVVTQHDSVIERPRR
jgi:hypothetical protein